MSFKCGLCGNEDELYIGYFKDQPYCRKCISFIGERVEENDEDDFNLEAGDLNLKYSLSKEQDDIATAVLENYKKGINTLIYAVCGAGKTELVFKVIKHALDNNQKVGFAIPRKDVVIELAHRLSKAFNRAKVIDLYGGHTEVLNGDIICLTTHQLYRYEQFFDLLILDEIDAFPYYRNDVLEAIFKRSVKGNYVLMSATPDQQRLDEFSKDGHETLRLFHRYHKHPIPVPIIKVRYWYFAHAFLAKKLKEYIKENKPCLVFVPTIEMSEELFIILKNVVKGGYFVNSKSYRRKEIIHDFRNGRYNYLITTAVLERGVTFKNLQVIIFKADHEIYNSRYLIQISGRAGRVIGAEDGEVIFLCSRKTKAMEEAIVFTREANDSLQKLLQKN